MTPTFLTTWTREPWWVVSCYTGNQTAENPYGLVRDWNDESRADGWLRSRFAEAVAGGARVVMLDRPMGGDGLSHVTGASWFTMPVWKRQLLARVIGSFADHLEVVPFVGTSLVSATRHEGWTTANGAKNLLAPEVLDDSLATLGGWSAAGVRRFVFDNAAADAGKPDGKADFYGKMTTDLFAGEAIPTVMGWPVMRLVNSRPWLATHEFIERVGPRWSFDPQTTRVYVWLNGDPAGYGSARERRRLVESYCRRGFIPVMADAGAMRVGKKYAGRKGWLARLM